MRGGSVFRPPRSRFLWNAVLAFLAIETLVVAALVVRARWEHRATDTPVVRGLRIAERAGCFGCHGPGGSRPIPNPGAKSGEVPGWPGGTWMMWNSSESDVREWIANGHPASREPDRNALISMPAYRDRLSEREIDDVAAYVLAVMQFGWPEDEKVANGREVAVKLGCFGCHGPEGRGLIENPGSFKGMVPPWDGADYLELVQDDAEFAQWVRKGISDRFKSNPAARFFLERQPIAMPGYGDRVSDADVQALLAYVRWVRENPRGAKE